MVTNTARPARTFLNREQLYSILTFLIPRLSKTEFFGHENLPREGGFILATNHLSRVDTPVLFVNPVRPDITALVADKYKKTAFFNWFLETAGAIWIDRDKADFTAFRAAVDAIRQGRMLGIAPEGTRSTTAQLLEGKPGVVLLALKADALIVPSAIAGSEKAFKMVFTLRKPHIVVRFGKPLRIPPLSRENREKEIKLWTDEIMCRIAAMLPEEYRGFYRDFPRVKELLTEGV